MSLKIRIADGYGTDYEAQVTRDHALLVSVVELQAGSVEPIILTRKRFFRDYFYSPGGATAMRVDASGAAVEYAVAAAAGVVRWVTTVRLIVASTGMEMDTNDFRKFGAAALGLTNGIGFFVNQSGVTVNVFTTVVKLLGDFLNYAQRWTNIKNSIGTQCDYCNFDFDFVEPVALPAGSLDKLVIRLNDNFTTALSADGFMYALATGYQESL